MSTSVKREAFSAFATYNGKMTHSPLSYSFLIIMTSGKKTPLIYHLLGQCLQWGASPVSLWPQDTTLYTQQQEHGKAFIAPSLGRAPACLPGHWDTNTLKKSYMSKGWAPFKQWLQNHTERGEIPLTTSPVNSQKRLVRENAFVASDRWKSLGQGSNSLLQQGREAEQTSRMCLQGGRAQQDAQAQAHPFLRAWFIPPRTEERLHKFEQWHLVRFVCSAKLDRKFHHTGHDTHTLHNSPNQQDF